MGAPQKPGCVALLALLAACAPDRLYVEGTHGWGGIDPDYKEGSYDVEGDAVTVGLSWPLQRPPERVVVERYVMTSSLPASPTAQPIAPDEGPSLPWEEMLFILGGAAGLKGGEKGWQKLQTARSQKREAKKTATRQVETS